MMIRRISGDGWRRLAAPIRKKHKGYLLMITGVFFAVSSKKIRTINGWWKIVRCSVKMSAKKLKFITLWGMWLTDYFCRVCKIYCEESNFLTNRIGKSGMGERNLQSFPPIISLLSRSCCIVYNFPRISLWYIIQPRHS